jgi:hypothetical protein
VNDVEQSAYRPPREAVTSTRTGYPMVALEILKGMLAMPVEPAVPVCVVSVVL